MTKRASGMFATNRPALSMQRIEALTDELAAAPYDALSPAELDEMIAELEPITAIVVAAGSQ